MKQLIQSFANGSTTLIDVPAPALADNKLIIKSNISLLSFGTEKMLVDFGKANLIKKASLQPEKFREVINKTLTDGPISTLETVKNKLESPFPMGYSNVGTVHAIGKNVTGFKVGDRVVSNGPHAEMFSISKNLCCKVPNKVTDQEAAFAVLAAIGLQGIRLSNPTMGETFLVSGLGLIGILTAQLLEANGCIVLGIDPDIERCNKAKDLGINSMLLRDNSEIKNWCNTNTFNRGVDGVLITASTTSSDPIELAASVSRKRGRIISVGVTGLVLKREMFYKKELTFQISCSYGPGRYDENYEEKSIDYPFPYVRWTEQRNFEAVLNSIKSGKLKIKPLISKIFPFEEAPKAYELLRTQNKCFGILFRYSKEIEENKTIRFKHSPKKHLRDVNKKNLVSFIGAGNYASRQLIPSFKKAGAEFYRITASNGLMPSFLARKFSFYSSSTDVDLVFDDKKCDSIVVATRHDSHCELIKRGLQKRKNIFVEKPLCINYSELVEIENLYSKTLNECNKLNVKPPVLMVGFNRRYAPFIQVLKAKIKNIKGPKAFIFTCNAGYIPHNHWIHDLEEGGGRLIGEACHFVDLLRYLVGVNIETLKVELMRTNSEINDTFSIQITFKDGSIGTVHYLSNGNKAFPKERLEVFANRKIFQLDNFLKIKSWGLTNNLNKRSFLQDKGQYLCVKAFLKAVENDCPPPIPLEEVFEVQRFILESLN